MPGSWVIVIPVKDAAAGKTRLSASLDDRSRAALARAMALDTIAAAAACLLVGAVVVVTPDAVVAGDAGQAARAAPHDRAALARGGLVSDAARADRPSGPLVRVVPEPPHAGARSGLDAAAAAGVAAAHALAPAASVGVLLGDLPALRPDDLAEALTLAESLILAEGRPRAMVADSSGTGTTLLTVAAGSPFDSRFGAGSAAAHAALGYLPLDVDAASTLRRDVDLPGDLDMLGRLDPGPRTARLLDRLLPDKSPERHMPEDGSERTTAARS